MDFPVSLDSASDVPIWKQLYLALYEAMASGRLRPGDPLPSTRQLARSLKISRDTVVRTYDDLIAQGYINTTSCTGTFVSRTLSLNFSGDKDQKIVATTIDRTNELSDFGRRVMRMPLDRTSADEFTALNYGAAPVDLVPARQWSRVLASHCNPTTGKTPAYETEVLGYSRLREALAGYLKRSKAINCEPGQIMIFRDGRQPLDLLARVLVNPGDTVAVENPGYIGARSTFLSLAAKIHEIPVDEQGMITEQLIQSPVKIKLAYVTPSHHDPTGAVLSAKRRRELLSWAKQTGALIIEDAFDSDYYYGSQAMPALQSMDQNDSVIYIYTFWKTLFPLSSIACIVVPKSLMASISKAQTLIQGIYSVPDCYALADFLTDNHLERHIRKTRDIYTKRRQALLFALTQNFKSAVSYPKESGGLHVLIRLNVDVSDEQILQCASKAGLPMISTEHYHGGNRVRGEFLVPFASIPEHVSERAVRRLSDLLDIATTLQHEEEESALGSQPELETPETFVAMNNDGALRGSMVL